MCGSRNGRSDANRAPFASNELGQFMAFGLGAKSARRVSRVLSGLCLGLLAYGALNSTVEARNGWRYTGYAAHPRHHYAHYYVARRPYRRYWGYHAPAYTPPFAAMVVDENSG